MSEGWGLVWAGRRFFVQPATVTLQNNEHDDTEHQHLRISEVGAALPRPLLLLLARIWGALRDKPLHSAGR